MLRQHNFSVASVRVTQPDEFTTETDHGPAPTVTIPIPIGTFTIPDLANPEFDNRLGVEDTLMDFATDLSSDTCLVADNPPPEPLPIFAFPDPRPFF